MVCGWAAGAWAVVAAVPRCGAWWRQLQSKHRCSRCGSIYVTHGQPAAHPRWIRPSIVEQRCRPCRDRRPGKVQGGSGGRRRERRWAAGVLFSAGPSELMAAAGSLPRVPWTCAAQPGLLQGCLQPLAGYKPLPIATHFTTAPRTSPDIMVPRGGRVAASCKAGFPRPSAQRSGWRQAVGSWQVTGSRGEDGRGEKMGERPRSCPTAKMGAPPAAACDEAYQEMDAGATPPAPCKPLHPWLLKLKVASSGGP